MLALLIATLIWSFSFGVIKQQLGDLPAALVAFCRLGIAALVFLPLLRIKPGPQALRLAAIGALQFGLMYLFYLQSYQYLEAYEVALFTIFTPIWVLLLGAILLDTPHSRLGPTAGIAVLLAVVGAGVILYQHQEATRVGYGFALMQAANFCFALGQVLYRRWMAPAMPVPNETTKSSSNQAAKNSQIEPASAASGDAASFAWLYLGATAVTALAAGWQLEAEQWRMTGDQIAAVAYLGVVSSGIAFYLWNSGARRVSIQRLAVANNLKVPLAVVVSLLFFHEAADFLRLCLGGGLIVIGLFVHSHAPQGQPDRRGIVPPASPK